MRTNKVSFAIRGLPVVTADGAGVIEWVNLQAPDYVKTESYQVLLDKDRRPGGKARCYAPKDVKPLVN